MYAILRKGSAIIIFFYTYLETCAIWLWIYCRKVRLVHLPNVLMVVSSQPWSLSAMASPAWSEWETTRSGYMPCWCSLSCLVAVRTTSIISADCTCYHVLLCLYVQMSVSLVNPYCRMVCTIWSRDLTGHMSVPVAFWWFFLPFDYFSCGKILECQSH